MIVNPGSKGGIVLEGPIAELREREVRLLYDVAEHIGKLGLGPESAADRQRLLDAAADLREMFLMVVVIGEFNAGKSTFVNALLGDSVLPMGITPTTDAIELVRYAPTPARQPTPRGGESGDAIREWGHPNTGAPGIVIVDTPGTGSVFQKHEQLAKSFLHRSDLVIFVISAKRAFAETERLYLDLAKSYGKKIVVVLNQVDLLDPKEEAEVKAFVRKQIDELLNLRPPIFAVSARKALQGEKPGGLLSGLVSGKAERNDFGMSAVRAHLRQIFEQVPPAQQKLLTQLDLLRAVTARYREAAQAKLALIGHDTDAAENLRREIEQQAAALDRQLESTVGDLKQVFDGVRERGGRFVEKNINVIRATLRGVNREGLQTEFERDVIGDALTRIASTQEQYVNALVDSGRAYWRGVIERLNKMEALLRQESGTMDAATYSDQRAALQSAMLLADIEMKAYTDNKVMEGIQADFDNKVRNFTYGAVGSIGGIVAVIVSIATPGALAVHPLAAIGFMVGAPVMVIGGGVAIAIWRRAVRDARRRMEGTIQEIEDGYRESIVALTTKERDRLLQYGKQILAPVFSQLQTLARRYKEQQDQIDSFKDRASGLESEVNKAAASAKPRDGRT